MEGSIECVQNTCISLFFHHMCISCIRLPVRVLSTDSAFFQKWLLMAWTFNVVTVMTVVFYVWRVWISYKTPDRNPGGLSASCDSLGDCRYTQLIRSGWCVVVIGIPHILHYLIWIGWGTSYRLPFWGEDIKQVCFWVLFPCLPLAKMCLEDCQQDNLMCQPSLKGRLFYLQWDELLHSRTSHGKI